MNRRLYFLLPDKMHALALVDELMENGIRQEHMHAQGGHTVSWMVSRRRPDVNMMTWDAASRHCS